MNLVNLFSMKNKVRTSDLNMSTNYQDELWNLIYGEHGINNMENLDDFLNTKLIHTNLKFANVLSVNGKIFQEEFFSKIFTLFIHPEKIEYIQNTAQGHLESNISNLFEAYKDYIVNLVQFYVDNSGFSFPLNCYPHTMLSEPFYEYISEDIGLTSYNRETRTYLYLKLIERIIVARFLELDDEKMKLIRDNLSNFTKSTNSNIVSLSKRLRDKLYPNRYNGVKCPESLIYISLLSDIEAKKLAKFSIRYFNKGTDLNALKLLYLGQLRIIPEDNEILASVYSNNPYFSSPLVIKNKQKGYISYIYQYLEECGYIINEKKWESIARHRYFKTLKSDGKEKFLTCNELSQSLGYKIQRKNSRKKTVDKELEFLNTFLINNFTRKKINNGRI